MIDTPTPCPDCTSGWVYADDVFPPAHIDGLIRCPTCNGRGSIKDEQGINRIKETTGDD